MKMAHEFKTKLNLVDLVMMVYIYAIPTQIVWTQTFELFNSELNRNLRNTCSGTSSTFVQFNVSYFLSATQLFKLLDKYRPESKQAKKQRLRLRAKARAAGKTDQPTKRPPVVRQGVNTVTTLIEQKKAQLVVISHDVDPVEVRSSPLFRMLNHW